MTLLHFYPLLLLVCEACEAVKGLCNSLIINYLIIILDL